MYYLNYNNIFQRLINLIFVTCFYELFLDNLRKFNQNR